MRTDEKADFDSIAPAKMVVEAGFSARKIDALRYQYPSIPDIRSSRLAQKRAAWDKFINHMESLNITPRSGDVDYKEEYAQALEEKYANIR